MTLPSAVDAHFEQSSIRHRLSTSHSPPVCNPLLHLNHVRAPRSSLRGSQDCHLSIPLCGVRPVSSVSSRLPSLFSPSLLLCFSSRGRRAMMFRDQVGVLTEWFKSWNECEQTVALLSLLKRVSRTQARFLHICLEHWLADCTEIHILEAEANNAGN